MTIRLEGFTELNRFVEALSGQQVRAVSRASLKAAVKPILKQAKANLKGNKRSGTLAREIKSGDYKKKSRSGKSFSSGKVTVALFATGKAHHAHLVESGTKERFNKAGASRGTMPATHFMENAVNSHSGTYRVKLVRELRKRMVKKAVQVARKAGFK